MLVSVGPEQGEEEELERKKEGDQGVVRRHWSFRWPKRPRTVRRKCLGSVPCHVS